jgi:glycosyltransferase involved in cell wall biosynthesis
MTNAANCDLPPAGTARSGSKVKLAYFLPLFPPHRGGAATDGEVLAPALSDLVELHVVTERAVDRPESEFLTSPAGSRYHILRILPRYASLETHGVRKLLGLIANRFAVALILIRVQSAHRIDVVHLHGQYARFGMAYLLAALGRILGVHMVLDIRDKGVRGAGLDLFERVLAASESVAANVKDYLSTGRLVLTPIPHAMPALLPSDGLPDRFFLFVGTVRRLKGVDVLLEAYRRYRGEGGTIPLVLIGPIVDPELVNMPDIVLLGPKPPGFVASAMQRCALFLLPSRSEGLPHVCLEAIDLHIPFVVGPGIPEIEKNCPSNVLAAVTPEHILSVLRKPDSVPRPNGYDLNPHAPRAVAKLLSEIYCTLLRQ